MHKNIKIRQAVILCGGLGTRLKNLTNKTPKPMLNCLGKPFLYLIMEKLSLHGIKNFLLLTGYKSKKIENYFLDGKKWKWNIKYSVGDVNLDTGERLLKAQNQILDNFLLLYSDNLIPTNFSNYLEFCNKSYPNFCLISSKKGPGNLKISKSQILKHSPHRRASYNYVDLGFWAISKNKFFLNYNKKFTQTNEFLNYFVKKKMFRSYEVPFYKSISDEHRLNQTRHFLKFKKIILLDRDGVINIKAKKGEYIKDWTNFKFIKKNLLALQILSKAGYKFIIISNQAGVGRKMLSIKELFNIDKNMKKILKKQGIDIVDSFYCLHHWNKNCECRKPQPGLFYTASNRWNLNLEKTLYIGDDIRDCIASYNANCKSVYIGKKKNLKILDKKYKPLYNANNIKDITSKILNYLSHIN